MIPDSAIEIAAAVKAGTLSAEEAARRSLAAAKDRDPELGAFLEIFEDSAIAAARAVDDKRKSGADLGSLAGVPVAIKDNILSFGHRASCGSKMLENYRAPYDSTVVARLKAQDAIILGRTNCDEFAMGSSTENSAFFTTKNPWDDKRVPGGSSGGSAAAVAEGFVPLALGSDTGGSIRQPASFCGVVGMKPTYGRVSRYGLIAFASSLDQIGPLSRTVADAALALAAIAGPDPRDSTCSNRPAEDYANGLGGGLRGLRIGIPREFLETQGLDPEVERSVRDAIKTLESLGASVKEISLPHSSYAVNAYYLIAPAEASSNLARFDGIRYGRSSPMSSDVVGAYELSRSEGLGPEVKRRIMLGTYALSAGYYDAYYAKAVRVRTLIRRDFDDAFRDVDILAAPTSPTTAFRLGEHAKDPLSMYLSDIFTIPANLAGIPALSLPCGLSRSGLPIGLQLLGPAFSDALLLRVAAVLEKNRPFPSRGGRAALSAS